MAPKYKIDPKTGAIIFQSTPEEQEKKKLQECLKVMNSIDSHLTILAEQNQKIIEQNNIILQILNSKEVV
jgi:hypothetical protein